MWVVIVVKVRFDMYQIGNLCGYISGQVDTYVCGWYGSGGENTFWYVLCTKLETCVGSNKLHDDW